ncbi:hemicentin-2-like isoform X2 [Portunus trituberculatus]|uniref:hemicentin-2-like isoform X2 n=1 Tax=Portunus trituberculatus TaxID=210409 RepID=UPI001E1CF984|nr:hemicentin-2-like isoform X2 [Portunus trituberculatus]
MSKIFEATRTMAGLRRVAASAVVVVVYLCLLAPAPACAEPADATTEDPMSKFRHLLPEANLSNNSVTNVTVQLGATAFLPCKYRHLADHQVSWFRRRDWHILTTGIFTYTNDARFSVLHPEETEDWTLQVKYTTRRDNGTYECQLSTGTGVISQFVNLYVVVPQAYILGSKDLHVQLGSTIKLTCVIKQSPTPPQYVFWYRNDHMINYDTRRGGINVTTEKGPTQTMSNLVITDARHKDSGNYTCSASNTQSDSSNVFVSHGDKMAAIQRRKAGAGAADLRVTWPALWLVLALTLVAQR